MGPLAHLSADSLKSLGLDALRNIRNPSSPEISTFLEQIYVLAMHRGLMPCIPQQSGMAYQPIATEDDRRLVDMLHDFYIEGLIRPGNDGNLTGGGGWPAFHMTEKGNQILRSQSPSFYDPDGYFSRIRAFPGILDSVISYTEESVAAARTHLHRSSVIALGVASEIAFGAFIDALVTSIADPVKSAAARTALDSNSMQRVYESFNQRYKIPLLQALKKSGDDGKDLAHNFDTYVGFLLSTVKEYRNDAGHALVIATSPRVAEAHLNMFPDYLEKIFGLITWLTTHPLSIP